ncbi:hypothetical protein CBL_01961 [Carabus blaptoides fortunei]
MEKQNISESGKRSRQKPHFNCTTRNNHALSPIYAIVRDAFRISFYLHSIADSAENCSLQTLLLAEGSRTVRHTTKDELSTKRVMSDEGKSPAIVPCYIVCSSVPMIEPTRSRLLQNTLCTKPPLGVG